MALPYLPVSVDWVEDGVRGGAREDGVGVELGRTVPVWRFEQHHNLRSNSSVM